ncbi:MAG: hypothetical protein ACRENJ_02425, partial [Candidatus Eiseniibacteriota bacterium]
MWLIALLLVAFVLIAPWWAVSAVRRQRRELSALRERLDRLEARVAHGGEALSVVPPPVVPKTQQPPALPEPIPLAPPPAS